MGDSSARAFVIGHSHVRTVSEAAAHDGAPVTVVDFWALKTPTVVRNGETTLCEAVTEQLNGAPVFSMIGGSTHHVGLLTHARAFDFVLPAAPDLPLERRSEIIPYHSVRAAMRDITEEYLQLMRLLRAATSGRLYHLEPPPVSGEQARMAPDLRLLPIYRRGATVAPRYMRYKLWRVHTDLLSEFCSENDIAFVRNPGAVADDEGFLRPEYYKDPMHANEAYGRVVLHHILELA
ncbi:MAG: hypothetical protein ACRD3G_06005 [Vicinamibacterales bacterium]